MLVGALFSLAPLLSREQSRAAQTKGVNALATVGMAARRGLSVWQAEFSQAMSEILVSFPHPPTSQGYIGLKLCVQLGTLPILWFSHSPFWLYGERDHSSITSQTQYLHNNRGWKP